jgi:phosphatidylserine decarboxylase
LPQLSPEARQIKRLIWRNERKFYKIKNKEGKTEIATISPER